MTQTEHHSQRVGLEGGGFIEATRDDTDEIQELHYAVWKDGNADTYRMVDLQHPV
ncbi:MAG TPA: hypothetical protein O0X23_05480 [Methanocorpusculum sp.]|nr:hypothetical protein [Methanocorpusculum sp.]